MTKGEKNKMNKIKSKILAALGAGILCMASISTLATEANISVQVNGKKVAFSSQKPQVISGTTYVPLRGVFEELGYEVSWIPSSKIIILTNENTDIILKQDSTYVMHAKTKALQNKILTIKGNTMLPLREVSTLVGAKTDWNAKTKTVIITSISLTDSKTDSKNEDNFSNDDVMNDPAPHKAQALYRYIEVVGKRKQDVSQLNDKYHIENHYTQLTEGNIPNYLKEYNELNNTYIEAVKAIEANEDFNAVKEKTINVLNKYNEVMKMLLIDKADDFPKTMEKVPHSELKEAILNYCKKNDLEAQQFFKDIHQVYGDTTLIWLY